MAGTVVSIDLHFLRRRRIRTLGAIFTWARDALVNVYITRAGEGAAHRLVLVQFLVRAHTSGIPSAAVAAPLCNANWCFVLTGRICRVDTVGAILAW